jgi:hypothetical protein
MAARFSVLVYRQAQKHARSASNKVQSARRPDLTRFLILTITMVSDVTKPDSVQVGCRSSTIKPKFGEI